MSREQGIYQQDLPRPARGGQAGSHGVSCAIFLETRLCCSVPPGQMFLLSDSACFSPLGFAGGHVAVRSAALSTSGLSAF